jgi:endonuclease/exonuclease/phosphatase (EEP) superfamily protein YafD
VVAVYAVIRHFNGSENVIAAWPMLALAVGLTAWHGFRILPYTPLMPTQSASTPTASEQAGHTDTQDGDTQALRMVMTNVQMENDQYDRWMETMREVDADLLLVVEIDQQWVENTEALIGQYPYRVIEPQDNWYGIMLLSRLPIVEHQVRHLVQQDVPSIDARLRRDDGTMIRFVGVHPRPPEPIRGNHATARDAELTLWGTELAGDKGPVIIGGDLNDVAWSKTTRLFLRTSGLLDPRRGRGFFNTFHAGRWYMRFPLDHIFHSSHFTVSRIKRLGFVGSDHFPIMIDLRFLPSQQSAHEVLTPKQTDEKEIEMRIQRAVQDHQLQGDAVDEQEAKEIDQVDAANGPTRFWPAGRPEQSLQAGIRLAWADTAFAPHLQSVCHHRARNKKSRADRIRSAWAVIASRFHDR